MIDEYALQVANPQPWERFGEWVHCICVITFDLELGQTIEVIYPGDTHLTASEKLQICYLSFPDSNNNCSRDTSYHFRVKRSPASLKKLHSFVHHLKFESMAPASMQPCVDYLFGFVHFRQQKDVTIPRGYLQKSVVLLTALPLFSLFAHIIDNIACNYFESGDFVIEKACQHIDHWPSPLPGITLKMLFLNSIIFCRIPSRNDVLHQQMFFETRSIPVLSSDIHSISSVSLMMQETYFYDGMKCVLSHSQNLWELILLGEPILVMAPTPAQSSQLVQSLVSLIWPFRYCNNYRPYFTIHDTDFNEIASKQNAPNVVLGVTNPFFAKTLNHWPNILRIDNSECLKKENLIKSTKNIKKFVGGKKMESRPGFYSQHKPFLNADKSLLKKLLKVGDRPDTVQNAILRKHFLELTQNFVIPLERHILSLMPLQKQISPFKALPQVKPFVLDEFLCTFSQIGSMPTCELKGDWRGLYKRFISTSPNFQGWLDQKLQDVNNRLKITHFEMLSTVDFNAENLSKCGQVEIVDIVLKLKDELAVLDIQTRANERYKIQRQLRSILRSVDDELKSILLSSEALRDVFNLV